MNCYAIYKDGAISIANNCFYIDSDLILNCNDRLHNYSRVSGHRIEDTGVKTISELVIENSKLHKDLFCGTPNMVYQNACFLCDCIIADLFMHKGEPLKAAEIGCNNGLLTAHIAPLLSAFDPNAKYVCVSNTIGNESNNIWLDIISQINTPEGFVLLHLISPKHFFAILSLIWLLSMGQHNYRIRSRLLKKLCV